jgi:hypothetical protein
MKETTMNMTRLTETQAAYLAGFIDGDGSILVQIVNRPDYVLKYQLRVSVLLIQKKQRLHFLKQFMNEIGSGTLRDRGDNIAELAIVGMSTVLPFLKQIKPFLRLKRKQANLVIQIIEHLPLTKNSAEKFIQLCQLADQVSELNDSKNRSITAATVEQTFRDLDLIEK